MGMRDIRIDDELVFARRTRDLSPGGGYIRIADTISRIAIRALNNHSGRCSVTDNEGSIRCRKRIDSARLDFEADKILAWRLRDARRLGANNPPNLGH